MDVLVALGTDASYVYSVVSILHHRFVQHDAMHYVPTVRECVCVGGWGLMQRAQPSLVGWHGG